MSIREATHNDIPTIAQVHVDTWRSTYQGIVPDEILANLSYQKREEGWYRIFDSALQVANFTYVAESTSGQIVGFANGGVERSGNPLYRGELNAIYILKGYQRRGIGRALVEKVARRLVQMEIYSMLVWVLADNPAGQFYEILGGKRICEKVIERGGVTFIEIAYGWIDTSILKQQ